MQIKQVIGATGFFSFGALVAWAVTADYYDKKVDTAFRFGYASGDAVATQKLYSDVGTEDSDQTRFIENVGQLELSLDPEPNAFGGTVRVVEENDEDDGEIPPGETPEETRSNLQNLIASYTADPDSRDTFVDRANRAMSDNQLPPFVIEKVAYAWDEEGEDHSKITLTYYPRDRVLLDEEEDPVEDIDRTVGWKNLNQFGGVSGDPDVVFVRNRRLETDFEVVKEEDKELPLHIKYGMSKDEFQVNRAAGVIKLRQEDQ